MPHRLLKKEHEMILGRLNEFEAVINQLPENFDLKRLKEIFNLIYNAEAHQRKEEVLFKIFNEKGYEALVMMVEAEHAEMNKAKEVLKEVIDDGNIELIKSLLLFEGKYLIRKIREHMKKEDQILYPLAQQIIGEDELREIKERFDKIGYCFDSNIDDSEIIEICVDDKKVDDLISKLEFVRKEKDHVHFGDSKKRSFLILWDQ